MSENFGERMTQLKRDRGIALGGPGRTPRDEKYARQFAAVEQTFAAALPAVAKTYVAELSRPAPERCPEHGVVLRCSERGCEQESERAAFDHKAAQYVLDRLLGKPLTRSENAVSVRFVTEITHVFAETFLAVNELADPDERRAAFSLRLLQLGEAYAG